MGQINNISEADKVAYFTEGLKPVTHMEVGYQAPANFEDAWKLAVRYDIAMYNKFGMSSSKNNNRHSNNQSSHRNNHRTSPASYTPP